VLREVPPLDDLIPPFPEETVLSLGGEERRLGADDLGGRCLDEHSGELKELLGVLRTRVAQVVDPVIVRAVESLKEVGRAAS